LQRKRPEFPQKGRLTDGLREMRHTTSQQALRGKFLSDSRKRKNIGTN